MFSGTAQVSEQVFQFFVNSVCLLVRVAVVDKNKTVVCCLLATSAIMLSEKKKRKRKMWSKKWYLKGNISCDAHLLNELLETDVEDYINYLRMNGQTFNMLLKLRKLWDSLSELRSSLCERRMERTVLRPALSSVKTAQFTQFFRHV
jgi:hypothetical protein